MLRQKTNYAIFIAVLTSLILIFPGLAQTPEDELELVLNRDFGFSSGTGKIQGTFSMRVRGPENLERVIFLIDQSPVFEDSETPFRYQFNTGNFDLGSHTLTAIGYTRDGQELSARTITTEFVPEEESGRFILKTIVPLFVVIFGLMALSYILPSIFRRRKHGSVPPGTERNYGLIGGTICPKCQRPFALNLIGLKLGFSRLDRCPHCGKWSLVRRQSLAVLRAAEAAELSEIEATSPDKPVSEKEKFEKALDDSRYQDI